MALLSLVDRSGTVVAEVHFVCLREGRGKIGSTRDLFRGLDSNHFDNPSHMMCEATGDRCILDLIASIPFSCRLAGKQSSLHQVASPVTRSSFG